MRRFALTAPHFKRVLLAGAAAAALLCALDPASAQETIVIGGSGRPPIEVNMPGTEAPAARGISRLLMPGTATRVGQRRAPDVDITALNIPPEPRGRRTVKDRDAPSAPKSAAPTAATPPGTTGPRVPATLLPAEVGTGAAIQVSTPRQPPPAPTQVARKPEPEVTPPRLPPARPEPVTRREAPKEPAKETAALQPPPAPRPPAATERTPPARTPASAPTSTTAPALPPTTAPAAPRPQPAPSAAPQTPPSTALQPPPTAALQAPPTVAQPPRTAPATQTPPAQALAPRAPTIQPPPVVTSAPPTTLTPPPAATTAPPAAAPEPPARPAQTAALPPAMRSPDGPVVARMAFPVGAAKFSGADAEQLRALAKRIESNETRLQVQGYASGGSAESPSGARRLSLLRALEVRSYLIEQGIKGTRIDVRALGAPPDGVQDRVDIISLAP